MQLPVLDDRLFGRFCAQIVTRMRFRARLFDYAVCFFG
jgi:hypothetical protein